MENRPDHPGVASGCYFPPRCYGSVWRRALALAVDMLTMLVLILELSVVSVLVYGAVGLKEEPPVLPVLLMALGLAYLYFVELERSRFRTPGFRLAGLDIVDLNGSPPSRRTMLLRSLLIWLGPANLLLDLLWIPRDCHRQSLRDKLAGTYVVRHESRPAGRGDLRLVSLFLMGWSWCFTEVIPAASAADDRGRPGTGLPPAGLSAGTG